MKQSTGLVLQNKDGKVIRFLLASESTLCVAIDKTTKRLELVDESYISNKGPENFVIVRTVKTADAAKKPIQISGELTLRAYDQDLALKTEVQPTEEDEDRLPVFMKYSAAGHVGAIALVVLVSVLINKFFNKESEPVVVQVFQQEAKKPQPVVQAAKKPVQKQKVRNARVSNRTKVAQNTRNTRQKSNKNTRAAAENVSNMGALGVLGGFSKSMNGSGGLNVNATKNNPGVGYGGPAARGGHSRALVGKGLVASGSGSNGDVTGYGGYGTGGKGGGKPGYGSRRMGGSSSGSLYALSDEALIEGGLDMDQINAVVNRNKGQLRQCYEQALQRNASLSGSVNIKFVISASGNVSTASVGRTSLGARAVETCMVSKLRGWRFPKPVGNVSVRVDYPFVLKRNG